jgi:hypothetical protein
MCLIVFHLNEFSDWPVVLAANRDEYYDREALPPRLLMHAPEVVGGQDKRAGGTWLGVNEHGVVAALTNCYSGPGQVAGRPSRGRLCLEALACKSATAAVDQVANMIRAEACNPFNLVLFDRTGAWSASNVPNWQCRSLPGGWHVLGNTRLDDPDDNRVARAQTIIGGHPGLAHPQPGPALLAELQALCRDHGDPQHAGTADTLCMHGRETGTRSSTLLCLDQRGRVAAYKHTDLPPCQAEYYDVTLPWHDAAVP